MELEEYKKTALQRLNKSIAFDSKESMYYACMGIMEETGEIIAEFRKPLFKGNFHEKSLDIEEIKSELGDLMWYISLVCKNANIDMNQLRRSEEKDDGNLPKRERLIQISIKMGEDSGRIVEEYQRIFDEKTSNIKLKEKIEHQYGNICELSEELGITVEDILNKNIEKVNSRYNEKGEVSRETER